MSYQHGKLLNELGFEQYKGDVSYVPINDTPAFTGLVRMMNAYFAICDHPDIILDLNDNKLDVSSPYLGYFNDLGKPEDVLFVLEQALNRIRKKQKLKPISIYMVPDSYHDTQDDADIVTLMFVLPFHKLPKGFEQYKIKSNNNVNDKVGRLVNRLTLWKDNVTNPLLDNDELERSSVFNTNDSITKIAKLYQTSKKVSIHDSCLNWNKVKAIVLHNMFNNRDYLINMKRYVGIVNMTPVLTLYNYFRIYNESNEIIPMQYTDNLQLILSSHKDRYAWSDFGFSEVLEIDKNDNVFTYTMSEFMHFLNLNSVDSDYKFAFTSLGYLFEDGYYTEISIFEDNYYNALSYKDIINATNITFDENAKHFSNDEKGILSLELFNININK